MKWRFRMLLALVIGLPALAHAQWYAEFDFVAPARSDKSKVVFQRNQEEELDSSGNPTGNFLIGSTSLLSANDLGLGLVAGGRLTTGYRGDIWGFETIAMFADEWQSSASVESTAASTDIAGLMASPFSLPGSIVPSPADYDSNFTASVAYRTQMASGEAYLTRFAYSNGLGDAWFLAGMRVMAIDESLTYQSENYDAGARSIETTIDNRLIGPQIGLLTETAVAGGFLDVDLKFALNYNHIRKTTFDGTTTGTGSDGIASALGEFGVKYRLQPNPHLAIQVGYQLTAISDIGLATDNFETNLPILSSGNARVNSSCVVYHTPYVGIVLSR